MLGALLSVSGTWCLLNLVCFALSSGADWIDHTPHTWWIGPSEAFSCFIPFYFSLPLQQTTLVCFSVCLFVHMYACRMSLVVLGTYIFNLMKFFPFPQDWSLMLHSCCYGVLLSHHIDSCILFHAGHPSHFTYAFFWCQTPGWLQLPLSQVMLWWTSLSVSLYGIGFQLGMILRLQGYLAISGDILSSDKWWKMLLASGQ